MPTTLANALPELVAAHKRLTAAAKTVGITFTIADLGGVRTQAQTDAAIRYRAQDYQASQNRARSAPKGAKLTAEDADSLTMPIEKWRPILPFGSSFHNYGAAFDVRPATWPANQTPLWAMNTLRALAPRAGLRVLNSKTDPWHFELDIPLDQARTRWQRHTGTAIALGGAHGSAIGVVALLAVLGIAAVLYFGNQSPAPRG